MNLKLYFGWTIILLVPYFFLSCEDFVEVDAPENKLIREEVFRSDETAQSAMTGIYNQLFQTSFCNGGPSSVTVLAGLSSDVIRNISSTNLILSQFENNEILPKNERNFNLWGSAYNAIYMANSLLEGLENTTELDSELISRLEGEARFIRAFSYFYLTNLYGDVPLLLTTNYHSNELASRESQSVIYSQILDDLHHSVNLLEMTYKGGERTTVNSGAAMALLARVYLYLQDWEMAENFSSQVIQETSTYKILEDLNMVFKANSPEAIWQISPIGIGGPATHTKEGSIFIIHPVYYNFANVQLEEELISDFDNEDLRLKNWIGFFKDMNAHYAYKYKIWNSNEFPIVEYSMVLRLAEQYLIRSEARAQQGNIAGAIKDIDIIKERAGTDLISETIPGIGKEELLNEIYAERKRELFTEWGHRWFDLKRTSRAGEILGTSNPNWDETDVLYPIPSQERIKNPNLTQNPGY